MSDINRYTGCVYHTRWFYISQGLLSMSKVKKKTKTFVEQALLQNKPSPPYSWGKREKGGTPNEHTYKNKTKQQRKLGSTKTLFFEK